MTKEANLAATERWGSEVASAGHYDVLDEILATSFVDHDPAPDQGPGIDGLKGFFQTMRSAFPDLKAEPLNSSMSAFHPLRTFTYSATPAAYGSNRGRRDKEQCKQMEVGSVAGSGISRAGTRLHCPS